MKKQGRRATLNLKQTSKDCIIYIKNACVKSDTKTKNKNSNTGDEMNPLFVKRVDIMR